MLASNSTFRKQYYAIRFHQFSSVQLLSCVRLCDPMNRSTPTPGVYPNPCPLSLWCHPTISTCCLLLLLPSIFPSIGVFSNESALCTRWPMYWSFSFNVVLPMNTQDWSPLGWTGWNSFQSKGLTRVFSKTTFQKHQFFSSQLSLQSNSHIHTWTLENHSLDETDICWQSNVSAF